MRIPSTDLTGARIILGEAFKINPDNEEIWLAAVKLENDNQVRAAVLLQPKPPVQKKRTASMSKLALSILVFANTSYAVVSCLGRGSLFAHARCATMCGAETAREKPGRRRSGRGRCWRRRGCRLGPSVSG